MSLQCSSTADQFLNANSRGFRLLHLKISKKLRKDRIESTFYTIEVEGCCYICVYFLKYLLRVELFYRIFKMDNFSPPKNMHYYKDKNSYWYIDFDKMAMIGGK